jgi:hypothetical protein
LLVLFLSALSLAVLNEIRIRNPEHHVDTSLTVLETALDKLNFNQGLGFTMAKVVVNKATLKTMAAKIIVVLPTAIAAAVAISPAASSLYAPAAGAIEFNGDEVFKLNIPVSEPETSTGFDLVTDSNERAFAFSGWIMSTDPALGTNYVFDFYKLDKGFDTEHIALHFLDRTAKLCYDTNTLDGSQDKQTHLCTVEALAPNQWHHIAVIHNEYAQF